MKMRLQDDIDLVVVHAQAGLLRGAMRQANPAKANRKAEQRRQDAAQASRLSDIQENLQAM